MIISEPGRSWLDDDAVQRASDIALGVISAAIAVLAIADVSESPFSRWDRLNGWFFPASVAGLLVLAGTTLLVRGSFLAHRQPLPWGQRGLLNIACLFGAAGLAAQEWGRDIALQFGPSDLATLVVLGLALGVALARRSRVRAAAMVLLGLLLSTVGTDVSTGIARFTFGFVHLADGIAAAIAALGMIVVGDAVICFASPALYFQTYARQVAGWTSPSISPMAGVALRIVAALAVAEACFYTFRLNASTWDVGELFLFGVFGIACRIFGWNRLVLMLGMTSGVLLEENIRRAMLISRGDPATFLRWPFSATFLLLAFGVLAVAILWPARRSSLASRGVA
jgi:TctA family transporter